MRCLLRNILVSLILFSIICSCDNSRKQDRLETVSVDSITELPLPSVPSGITTTEDRAAFVARHFWDALDFRSDPLAVDTAFMEQNFANFISVLAVTPQDRASVRWLSGIPMLSPFWRASLKNISTTPTLLCATKICSYCFSRIGSRPIQ